MLVLWSASGLRYGLTCDTNAIHCPLASFPLSWWCPARQAQSRCLSHKLSSGRMRCAGKAALVQHLHPSWEPWRPALVLTFYPLLSVRESPQLENERARTPGQSMEAPWISPRHSLVLQQHRSRFLEAIKNPVLNKAAHSHCLSGKRGWGCELFNAAGSGHKLTHDMSLRGASWVSSLPCASVGSSKKVPTHPPSTSTGHRQGAEASNAKCMSTVQISVSTTPAPDENQSYKIPLHIWECLPVLPALGATCQQTHPPPCWPTFPNLG